MLHPAPAERVPEVRPAHHLVSHHTAELAQAVRYHHILLLVYSILFFSWSGRNTTEGAEHSVAPGAWQAPEAEWWLVW